MQETKLENSFFSPSPLFKKNSSIGICNTWTFQTALSSVKNETPSDITQLPSSSYIIAGSCSAANNLTGRLIKLSEDGTVIASKELSLPGYQVELRRLHFHSVKGLYGIGTITDGAGATTPVLINIDTSTLSVQSVSKLNPGSGPTNWKGFDFSENPMDSSFFVLLNNDSLINITKFKPDLSTITWSKTYRPKNAPQLVGIGIEALDVFVAWNETDSGYSKAAVINMDHATGNFRYGSKIGGPSQGFNIELQGMSVINLRARFTALEYDNTNTRFVRLNYEVNAYPNFKEYFAIAGFTPSTASFTQENAWSESIAIQQAAVTNDVTIIQTFPDNYNTPIRASVISHPVPVQLKRQCIAMDGGNITLLESGNGIVLSKVDSVISLPSCSSTQVAASFSIPPKPAYLLDTPSARALIFQLSPLSISENDLPLTQNWYCKTQYCPTVNEPDSCQRTFLKEYRNATNCITVTRSMKLGNEFLLSGSARSLPYSGGGTFSLIKMDTLGHVKDARLVSGHNLNAYKNIPLRDGNFLVVGTVGSTFSFAELFFAKIDPQFNIIWQQKLTSSPFFNGVGDVVESKEGDLYCYLIDHETSFTEARDILKLDAAGRPVWLRKFTVSPDIFAGTGEFIPAIVELGDNVILKYNDEDGDMSPHLMSLRKSDGSINWVRKYQMTGPYNGSNSYALTSLLSDGYNIYMAGRTQDKDLFLKIRPDGTVALAKKGGANTIYCSKMSLKTDGRLLIDAGYPNPSVNGVIEMDTSFQVLRSQYMRMPKYGGAGGVMDVNDSLVYEAGSLWNDNPYSGSICFLKYNFNSSFSVCTLTDQVFVLDNVSQPTLVKTIPQTSLPLPVQNSIAAQVIPQDVEFAAYYCGNNPLCSEVHLQGPTKICDSSNVYSFKAVKNPGCNGFVIWKMDTATRQVKLVSITDSVLQLKVLNGGRFKIHSKVFASCGWLEDSISVEASPQNSLLDLGRDTTLCEGNTLVLHANPGFASYQWQDGSTDSLFTAKTPGLYYVQVSSCNNILSDTVIVSPHPPIAFYAGTDRTKCNSDTLHLGATPGFLNYSWSPDYNTSSTTAANVVINPLVDTTYYVKAEKIPRCFAYDTVHVKVYNSLPVYLGRDTSFCFGSYILLSAPPSFSNYTWSTGETSQQIKVSMAGTYSVVAKTNNGCISSDTMSVNNVYPLPVISLDKNPELCTGSNRLLDPGTFISYLWQNGSPNRTQLVTSTGTFYVMVTDQHGCVNSDTTVIKTMLTLPSGFLPPDTSLCSYEAMSLQPTAGFKQYLWNNGATTPSISISTAGLYWLQVTDKKGCSGRDSVVVNPKECLEGIYLPTAFSPNGDALNDEFRALLFGNVRSFELTIYNRWGQVIFKTNDRFKGWNGKLGGVEQRSDVYIWSCRYQLEGEPIKLKKGTVTLVR